MKVNINLKKALASLFAVFFLAACSNDASVKSGNTKISGVAQKGPFKKDSLITIYELKDGVKTGEFIETKTTDDKGSYSVVVPFKGAVLIEASGDYLNEKTGATSSITKQEPLSLAIQLKDEANEIKGNVNVLTNIASKNVIKNLKENMKVDEALQKANETVSQNFGLDLSKTNLNELDLTDSNSENNVQNAQLLKLSVAISSSSNPSETIKKISEDLEDGKVDDTAAFNNLNEEQKKVDLDAVAQTLKNNGFENTPKEDLLKNILLSQNNISFPNKTRQALNVEVLSNTLSVNGIDGEVDLSIENGFYSLNNNSFTNQAAKLKNGDTLQIKHTSSSLNNTEVSSKLTIGGVVFYFKSITKQVDEDIIAPSVSDAQYSSTVPTNQNVTVTFTSNDTDIVTPNGWTKSGNDYRKVYSSNANETVVFADNSGNETSKQVSISNIDKTAPTASVAYSTTNATKNDVIVSITLSKDVQNVSGWTKNQKVFTKTYTSNISNQTITFTDLAGNSVQAVVNIANIDKTAPIISDASYSTQAITNSNVVVSFTSSSDDVLTPNTWTKSGNKYTKTYASNVNTTVTFTDNVGNTTVKNISISNIDKTAPVVNKIVYSTTAPTNASVIATFTSSENLNAPSSWVKTNANNLYVYKKTYTANTNETVVFTDNAGNNTSKQVSITNIDKTAPSVTNAKYSITNPTKQNVTVTFTSSNTDIVTPNGWTKSGNDFTKVYSSNANETVVFADNAGNETSKQVSISNIDKTAPSVTNVSYSSTTLTKDDVSVVITVSEDVTTSNDWSKSGNKFTKVYSANVTNEEVIFTDLAGNTVSQKINIANIDKTAPVVNKIVYSTTAPTNASVIATFTSSENLNAPSSWVKTNENNLYMYKKTYAANANETVVFTDNAGNETSKQVSIANIDKTAPTASVSYSSTTLTKDDVIVSITLSEDVQAVNGWTKNQKVFTKTYTANTNGNETITFTDLAGNSVQAVVNIANIDKVKPKVLSTTYSTTDNTNQNVTVTITLDKKVKKPVYWNNTDASFKVFKRAYSANVDENATFVDEAGNTVVQNVSVSNINKETITLDTNIKNNATNVSVSEDFILTFNKDLKNENISSAFLLSKEGQNVSISPQLSGNVVTIDLNLESSASYTLTIKNDVLKDLYGNVFKNPNLSSDLTINFTSEIVDNNQAPTYSVSSENFNSDTNKLEFNKDSILEKRVLKFLFSEKMKNSFTNNVTLRQKTSQGEISKVLTYEKSVDVPAKEYKTLRVSIASQDLEYGTAYEVVFNDNIQDLSSNTLENANKIYEFTTQDAPDTKKPSINYDNSTIKESGSLINIGINQTLTISFDEELKDANIDKTTFALTNTDDNSTPSYTVAFKANDKSKVEIVLNNLAYLKEYSLKILGNRLSDNAGNLANINEYHVSNEKSFTFTTQDAPDLTAPQVASTTPNTGDSDIVISANLTVTFNEEVKDYSSSSVVLTKDLDDSLVATTLTYANKVLTINPNENLENNTAYKLLLKTTIKDLANNALENEVEITFTTVAPASDSCSGTKIDGICYEVSTDSKKWDEAKTTCEQKGMLLVSKDSISDPAKFTSDLSLEQRKYWLLEGEKSSFKQVYYFDHYDYFGSSKSRVSSEYYSSSTSYKYICMKDTAAPTASLASSINANSVNRNAILEITFNEDIQNVNSTNIILKNSSDVVVASTITYSNKVASIKPTNNLDANANYTITLKEGITDVFGNKLVEKTINFTTNDQVASSCITIGDKCFKILSAVSKSNAKSSCTTAGGILATRDDLGGRVSSYSALSSNIVSTLKLQTSNKYWFEYSSSYGEYIISYKSGYGNWYSSTASSSTTAYPICKMN